ncbi:MAG: J domain-containing protein [Nanoarchaeota archaeon]
MVLIKGHEIAPPTIRDSFNRRATQIENSIVGILKKLGVERHSIDIPRQIVAQKKHPATVSWYFEGRNLKYSYGLRSKFVENLSIIEKVLRIEVERLISKEILTDDFVREFTEDDDLHEQRKEARVTLCVKPDEMDFEVITKNYKLLAKKYHPDMPNGDHECFQRINAAHKVLKKELM